MKRCGEARHPGIWRLRCGWRDEHGAAGEFAAAFGAEPRYAVPRRMDEGYGLSRAAWSGFLPRARAALFIALDCGTGAVEEVKWLRARGCEVIIVDHHTRRRSCRAIAC